MEYYNLDVNQMREVDNISKQIYKLSNELGSSLFEEAYEDGNISNFEPDEDGWCPEVMQWWIVSDWLAEKLDNDGQVVMYAKGETFWGRCGCGYDVNCDLVSIWKGMNNG